jgi:hypothetical protein
MSVEVDLSHVSGSVPEILTGRFTTDEWTTIHDGTSDSLSIASLCEGLIRIASFFLLCGVVMLTAVYVVFGASLVPSVWRLFNTELYMMTIGPMLLLAVAAGATVASLVASQYLCDLVFGPVKPLQTEAERTESLQKFFASPKIAVVLTRERAKLKTRVTHVPAHGRFSGRDKYQHVLKFSKAKK